MLTQTQNKTLIWIEDFIRSHEYSPTYDEITAGMGLLGKSSIHRVVHSLRERGFIDFRDKFARDIVLLKPAIRELKYKYIKMDFNEETQRYVQTEVNYDPTL